MSAFVPSKQYLREIILHYFIATKSPAETHRLLVDVYGEHAPSITTCKQWFQRFRNNDFNLDDREHGRPPKKFKDDDLKALLDGDSSITLKELAAALAVSISTVSRRLQLMGMVQKEGNWVPREQNEAEET